MRKEKKTINKNKREEKRARVLRREKLAVGFSRRGSRVVIAKVRLEGQKRAKESKFAGAGAISGLRRAIHLVQDVSQVRLRQGVC